MSLHPSVTRSANIAPIKPIWPARRAVLYDRIGLEPHVDVEPEAAARRVRTKLESAGEDAVERERVRLRVSAAVGRELEQVPARHADPHEARTAPDLLEHGRRHFVRDLYLAE